MKKILSPDFLRHTGVSGPEKSRKNTREKISYFFTYIDVANRLPDLSRIIAARTQGGKKQYAKWKTESSVFSGFGVGLSRGWEWKSTTGKFATGRFRPFTWRTSSVGKDKVYKWEFCKWKITTIVVFVITIQRIFPSQELASTHSTIAIRGLSIHLFSFINEIGFSCLEEKFHIYARPCIILYIFMSYETCH